MATRHICAVVVWTIAFFLLPLGMAEDAGRTNGAGPVAQREYPWPPAQTPAGWEAFTSRSGIKTCVVTRPETDYVTFVLSVQFGRCCVPENLGGGAWLLTRWMKAGTDSLTERGVNYRLGKLSGEIEVSTSYDKTVFQASVSGKDPAAALGLLLEMVYRPRLEENIFHRTQKFMLDEIKLEDRFPSASFRRKMLAAVFPDHPIGWPPMGTDATLRLCKPLALRCLHGLYMRPAKSSLVVVGRMTKDDVIKALDAAPAVSVAEDVQIMHRPLPGVKAPGLTVSLPQSREGFVFVGWALPSQVSFQDRLALAVLGEALVGLNGRLTTKIRKEKGLTYSPMVLREFTAIGGLWGVMLMAPRGKEQAIRDLIKADLEALCDQAVTDEELRTARDAVIASLAKVHERNDSLAINISEKMTYGMSLTDYAQEKAMLDALRPATLTELVRRISAPQRLVSVITE